MKSRRLISVIAALLAVLMLFGVLITGFGAMRASAVSQSDIDRLESERDEIRERKNDIQEQMGALESEMASVIERKEALDEQNELLREDVELINEQIELYDEMIREKELEVKDAKQREEEQYDKYRKRVRAMEENDTWSYISVIFQATSFADFLASIDDVMDIMERDKKIEEDYIEAREELERIQAEYEQTREEQKIKREELRQQRAELEEEIEAAYKMIADLEKDIEEYKTAYEENEALENAVQAKIDDKIAELERQRKAEEEARRRQQGSTATTTTTAITSGYYQWPCPSCTYITSRFGYRIHPIFGTQKFHSGIDIAAQAGATICAAASGTVQIAEYSSSYGNYVVVYHDNGSTTLYGHMSSMAVSVGQTVSAGDTLGYVGSTGWSTGPHLHFEIRVNGSCIDPTAYFSGLTYSPDA